MSNDLVKKSQTEENIVGDMAEILKNFRKINMNVNLDKSSFGFQEGKFLRHIVRRYREYKS